MDSPLNLDNQLCFALYVCSKEIIRRYKKFLDPLNLTYTGYIVMMALWEKDDIPVKELGERLFLDSGTLTPLLKKLESQGLVCRSHSNSDERVVNVVLTADGKKLKKRCESIPKKMACACNVDSKKATCMVSGLHDMIKSFSESTDSNTKE